MNWLVAERLFVVNPNKARCKDAAIENLIALQFGSVGKDKQKNVVLIIVDAVCEHVIAFAEPLTAPLPASAR